MSLVHSTMERLHSSMDCLHSIKSGMHSSRGLGDSSNHLLQFIKTPAASWYKYRMRAICTGTAGAGPEPRGQGGRIAGNGGSRGFPGGRVRLVWHSYAPRLPADLKRFGSTRKPGSHGVAVGKSRRLDSTPAGLQHRMPWGLDNSGDVAPAAGPLLASLFTLMIRQRRRQNTVNPDALEIVHWCRRINRRTLESRGNVNTYGLTVVETRSYSRYRLYNTDALQTEQARGGELELEHLCRAPTSISTFALYCEASQSQGAAIRNRRTTHAITDHLADWNYCRSHRCAVLLFNYEHPFGRSPARSAHHVANDPLLVAFKIVKYRFSILLWQFVHGEPPSVRDGF